MRVIFSARYNGVQSDLEMLLRRSKAFSFISNSYDAFLKDELSSDILDEDHKQFARYFLFLDAWSMAKHRLLLRLHPTVC